MTTDETALVEQDDYEYDDDEPDCTCKHCGGDGSDPWSDGVLPCPDCDGEGYRWWE